jgi:murein DD-endopeptidase MepM/ murein hydrolase activator NlpD
MIVMMKKKLTLMIFDATGTPVRQTCFPKALIPIATLFCFCMIVGLAMGISEYFRMKGTIKNVHTLRANLQKQEELVAQRQDQIKNFALKIGELKTKIVDLYSFEQKIRVIANLENRSDQSSMFGVGGADPDDLDPSVMMKQGYQELVRDMHEEINEIDHASQSQHDSFSSIFSQLEGKRNLLAATPSIRPVKGWISSKFGRRKNPFTGRRQFHRGLDIATRSGAPILAPADGIVTFAGRKGLMGNMLTIEHGFGMVTRYGHIKKFMKKKGDRIKRGETIALVGNTGRSTGPHLHYEVRLNGLAVNPTKYFFN